MNAFEGLLTDESTICLTNGEKITGTKDVSKLLLECCEEYNAGYIRGMKIIIFAGIMGGLVTGSIIGMNKIIKRKKKTQK